MAEDVRVDERQLVLFGLGSEAYGVDIGTVREIIQLQEVTNVPGTSHFVEGLINLRGTVIPVIDLRKRFGLEELERGKANRIVVVSAQGQDIGMIVDSVTEVLRISSDSIEPPSSTITGADSDYLLGIVKLKERLIILLDAEKLLSIDERTALAVAASQAEAKGLAAGAKEKVKRSSNSDEEKVVLVQA